MKKEKYVFGPTYYYSEKTAKEEKFDTVLNTIMWTVLVVLILMMVISQIYMAVKG